MLECLEMVKWLAGGMGKLCFDPEVEKGVPMLTSLPLSRHTSQRLNEVLNTQGCEECWYHWSANVTQMIKMVKQSAVLAKVPVKNKLDESRLNFFMSNGTSNKFHVWHQTSPLAPFFLELSAIMCLCLAARCTWLSSTSILGTSSSTQAPGMLFRLQHVAFHLIALHTRVCT
jgi:hypothetical protein